MSEHENQEVLLKVEHLCQYFKMGDSELKAVDDVNFDIKRGEVFGLVGESGCGKTTLLSLLGGLDSPTSGAILFEGKDVAQTGLAGHRKKNVSFIFQSYNLIDYMTPQENVRLISKKPAFPFLERLGLTKEETRRNVLKLSGGQQQRVAIARALIAKPDIIFADEPTGNLDSKSGSEVMEMLQNIWKKMGKTLVIITHDSRIARMADRQFVIVDGVLSEVTAK